MLQSRHASSFFNEFSTSYQNYAPGQTPFVYVDQKGSVKLLTNVVQDNGEADGIFAVSMAQDGWIEFLSLNR